MNELPAITALTLAREGTLLLDVREPSEWSLGHSPIAVSIPMSELNARIHEIPDNGQILVVCHSGSRSDRVADALRQRGFDATNILGGMVAWERAGGELVSDGVDQPRVD